MNHFTSMLSRVALIALVAAGAWVGLTTAEAAPKGGGGAKGKDKTPPSIICPSEITTDATYSSGAYVWFEVSATDDKDPSPTVSASPRSGSLFPVGTTTVTVTATDWRHNTSTQTFDVTVLPFTQTILPRSGTRTYKAWWTDSDGSEFFEWDITVSSDGTVSGSGHQTNLFQVYDEYNQYIAPLPSGLSGAGVVSGTMSNDGSCELESSASYWVWNYGDVDEAGNPVYTEETRSFSGSITVIVDAAGNLFFNAGNPLASPGIWDDYGLWYVQ